MADSAVLILFFGWGLWKSSQNRADGEVRFRSRRWVAALLLSILLLGTVATWLAPDPLSTPLARFQRLQPKVLMQGTRLRLWRVGLEMIREQPLGVGFAGFKLHYPQYQGLYFERYPDSELRPTSLRSGRAHNEYLQLAIEMGLLGAVVLVWLLACSIKWARSILCQRYGPPFAVRLSLLMAMLGVLLHNLVTFEFHIISSAVLFLFSWAWLSSLNPKTDNKPPLKLKSFWIVSGLVGVLALQIVPVAAYQAEELFRQGHFERRKGFKQGLFGQVQDQIDSYRQASRMLESAYSLAPYRGDFAYYAGWCYLETGRVFSSTYKLLLAEKALNSALQWFDRAEETFSGSTFERDRADAHYLLGMIDKQRSGNNLLSSHLLKAECGLKKAAWLNPQDTELPFLLGQYYDSIGDATRSRQTWLNAAAELPQFIE